MRLTKIFILNTVVFIIAVYLLYSLFYLQNNMRSVFKLKSKNNHISLRTIRAIRGNIYDREKRVISYDRPSYTLAVHADIKTKGNDEINLLNKIVKEGEYSYDDYYNAWVLKRELKKEEIVQLEVYGLTETVCEIISGKTRMVKDGMIFGNLVGYMNKISKDEYRVLREIGYLYDDSIGREGIENKFEKLLRGAYGFKWVEVDSRGRILGDVLNLTARAPERGKDIILTIDYDLQKAAYDIWPAEYSGVFAVSSVKTGDILVLQSFPQYDSQKIHTGDREYINEVLNKKSQPLFNRALKGVYPMGSVFKIITSFASFDRRDFNPYDKTVCGGRFHLGGSSFKCWKETGHGAMDLYSALVHSCNVYFYSNGLKTGYDKIINTARLFGLGVKTGVELDEEAGLLGISEGDIYPGDVVNIAIGQGYVAVTPLQVLKMITITANGGGDVNFRLVKTPEIITRRSTKLKMREESFKMIQNALTDVVKRGTGYYAGHSRNYRPLKKLPAGKTGTAQIVSLKTAEDLKEEDRLLSHAWFAGWYPADEPKIAFVVLVENSGSGGQYAAPLIHNFLKKAGDKIEN